MTTLPLEILEHVIGFLSDHTDDDNLESIRACSIVCSDLFFVCRKHLFATITLNGQDAIESELPTISMLHKLLSTSPQIGDHIRHLTYYMPHDSENVDITTETFKKINNLQTLGMIAHLGSHAHTIVLWHNNPFRPALLHFFPTLKKLALDHISEFPVADFAICSNLEALIMGGVTFVPLPYPSDLAGHTPTIKLRKLTMAGVDLTALLDIRGARYTNGELLIDLNGINNLTIGTARPSEIPWLINIFKFDKLTDINLESRVNYRSWDGFSGFFRSLQHSMHSLKLIKLGLEITWDAKTSRAYDFFIDEFTAMRGTNVIQTFMFRFVLLPTSKHRIRGKLDTLFDRLDTLFTQPGWPSLHDILIEIVYRSQYLEETLRNLKEAHFPKLSTSETVNIELRSSYCAYDDSDEDD